MAAKIKVTRFESQQWSIEHEVNNFLEETGFGLDEVHIQFVTSRYIDSGAYAAGVENELFEAYVTHPA